MRLLILIVLFVAFYIALSNYKGGYWPSQDDAVRGPSTRSATDEGVGERMGKAVDKAVNRAGVAVERLGEELQAKSAPSEATPVR